ncbi:uncharacterized protein LOC118734400 [Rhagoletis pomonella]|uniref:uncharacterized protein LOC118734400 n=1 Tax=Rhagoletis pomonella TaxID=28610 RepID=UPI001785CDAD|nr:uncharacterized protein LOC118734400 [Rhagoletis pomonella]
MNKSADDASQKATSTQHTDDESITTSTESDSLETWTLVNDKNKKKNPGTTDVEESTSNRLEILSNLEDYVANDSKGIHESAESRTDEDSNNDDISEGISIISESESAGRASPYAIAENLNSADLKSYPNPDDVSPASMLRLPIHLPQSSYSVCSSVHTFDETTLRQRRIRRSSSSTNSERKAVTPKDASILDANPVYPLVRRSLKGLFFICVVLAILAFIGKLRNPDWQPFFDTKNLPALEQRLTDLELQNNLMRAEIDILSKQLNFLSSLSESGRFHKVEGGSRRQQRLFKQTGEWIMKQKGTNSKELPINKDSADNSQIIKELRKPIKCPNGKLAENEGMCVENSEPEIKNMDNIFNVDYMQSLKNAPLDESTTNPYVNEPTKNANNAGPKAGETEFKNMNKYINTERKNSKEYDPHNFEKRQWKRQKYIHPENDDDFSEEDEDDSAENFGNKKFSSKESYNKHDRNKERRYSGNTKDILSDESDEQSRKSGEWHGKLMQQRENARRQNEYRQRNKNWYIERGNSREKIRHRR